MNKSMASPAQRQERHRSSSGQARRPDGLGRLRVWGRLAVLIFGAVGISSLPAQTPPATAPAGKVIREVRVEGLKAVAANTVLNKIRSRAGAVFDEKVVSEDAQRIIVMPQVYDVKWRVEPAADQINLIFTVSEAPQISSVEFVGNKNIKKDKLQKELKFASGDFVDRYLIDFGADALTKLYRDKGYYYAKVTLDENLLKSERRVVYIIAEGPRLRVKKVKFEGNKSIRAGKLEGKIKTKGYFPIFSKGALDDDQLEQDRLALASYYHGEGFLDARVFARTLFNEAKTRVVVQFVVEEGVRYKVSRVRFSGNKVLADQVLVENLKLQTGKFFTKDRQTVDERTVKRRYGKDGYIYAEVRIEPAYTDREGEVEAVFNIVENSFYYLGRVIVRGNHETQDKVIRRDFDAFGFVPGGLYDTDAMEKGKKRLGQRSFFDDLNVLPVGNDPNQRDALIEVTEGRTGLILFGVGVDTNSGVMGQFSVEQRNFDIARWPGSWEDFFSGESNVGAGQRLRFDFEPGTEVTRSRIRFYEPYLLDQPYYLDTSAYMFRRWRESYLENRLGANITLGRRFANDVSVELGFRVEQVKVSDLEDGHLIAGDPNSPNVIIAPPDVQDVEGHNFLTSIRAGVGLDKTDSLYRPTTGYKINADWEQYGAMGGDFTFASLGTTGTLYRTLYEDIAERKTVWAGMIRANTIVGDAPVFERYYAGGIGSIRGFEYRGVSPRYSLPTRNDHFPIGSDWLFLANNELTHPLYEETLFGKVFVDSGMVSEGPYRIAPGFGLEVLIPQLFQMVPMNFDFAFPITFSDEDEKQVFSFSFGMTF